MRRTVLLLALAAVCGGCSTAGVAGARQFSRGPDGVDIVTPARPYVLPPIYQMATTYCARSGKGAVLSSVYKTPFGSLVHAYHCEEPVITGSSGQARSS